MSPLDQVDWSERKIDHLYQYSDTVLSPEEKKRVIPVMREGMSDREKELARLLREAGARE